MIPGAAVRLLVACRDAAWVAELAAWPGAAVVAQAPTARPVAALLAQQLADALVLDAGLVDPEEWPALVRFARQVAPELRVIWLLPREADDAWARRAVAAGGDAALPWPWAPEAVVAAAGDAPPWRAVAARPPRAEPGGTGAGAGGASGGTEPPAAAAWPRPTRGPAAGPRILPPQLVAVVSPKGGVGKTFLAVNLACAVAHRAAFEVVLADWDFACPDAGVLLDLDGGPTVADLLPRLSGLNPPEIRRYLARHGPTGLHVLPGPHRPEEAEEVDLAAGTALLGLLRREFPFVVVDTGPSGADDLVFEVVEQATRIVVVTTPDAAALRQTRIFVDTLKRLNIPLDERAVLVLNRTTAADRVGPARAAEFLGAPVRVVVPADARRVEAAAFDGRPVLLDAPASPAGRALERLVGLVCPGLERAPEHRTHLRWIPRLGTWAPGRRDARRAAGGLSSPDPRAGFPGARP